MSVQNSFTLLNKHKLKRAALTPTPYSWYIPETKKSKKSSSLSAFQLAGMSYKPSHLINYLRSHGSRAQRRIMPPCHTVIECYKPCGGLAVEINFGEK